MKSKAKMWLLFWIISLLIATTISFWYHLQYSLQTGTPPPGNPLLSDPSSFQAQLQLILLLLCMPFIILPLLVCAVYYATKEKNKPIRIIGTVMIVHHALTVVVTLIQWIGHKIG